MRPPRNVEKELVQVAISGLCHGAQAQGVSRRRCLPRVEDEVIVLPNAHAFCLRNRLLRPLPSNDQLLDILG